MWYFPFQCVSGYPFSEELDLEDVMDIELDFPTIPETLNSASSSRHSIPLLEVGFCLLYQQLFICLVLLCVHVQLSLLVIMGLWIK